MNKLPFLLVFIFGFVSCKTPEKKIDKLEIAMQYYNALDASDGAIMKTILADSLLQVIPEYDFKQVLTLDAYTENWLKWDAVFDPTYKILEIAEENGIVTAKVSKMDKRINFLQQEAFITNEILTFDTTKIVSVETTYVSFKEKTWDKNKTDLLGWIDANHPELNGFIYDQTESGGIRFLKAIELYKNKN